MPRERGEPVDLEAIVKAKRRATEQAEREAAKQAVQRAQRADARRDRRKPRAWSSSVYPDTLVIRPYRFLQFKDDSEILLYLFLIPMLTAPLAVARVLFAVPWWWYLVPTAGCLAYFAVVSGLRRRAVHILISKEKYFAVFRSNPKVPVACGEIARPPDDSERDLMESMGTADAELCGVSELSFRFHDRPGAPRTCTMTAEGQEITAVDLSAKDLETIREFIAAHPFGHFSRK